MDLRDMIERGATITGSKSELARKLGLGRNNLLSAQAGRQALPVIHCYQLAEIIGLDPQAVTAAAMAFREKDAKKRAYFERFFKDAAMVAVVCLITTIAPQETQAEPVNGRVMCHYPPP